MQGSCRRGGMKKPRTRGDIHASGCGNGWELDFEGREKIWVEVDLAPVRGLKGSLNGRLGRRGRIGDRDRDPISGLQLGRPITLIDLGDELDGFAEIPARTEDGLAGDGSFGDAPEGIARVNRIDENPMGLQLVGLLFLVVMDENKRTEDQNENEETQFDNAHPFLEQPVNQPVPPYF